MTDDDLINGLIDYSSEVFSRPEIDRLIVLARIGAAVKPRPIEEVRPDGKEQFIQFSDPSLSEDVYGGFFGSMAPYVYGWAHTFVPLSAIPYTQSKKINC